MIQCSGLAAREHIPSCSCGTPRIAWPLARWEPGARESPCGLPRPLSGGRARRALDTPGRTVSDCMQLPGGRSWPDDSGAAFNELITGREVAGRLCRAGTPSGTTMKAMKQGARKNWWGRDGRCLLLPDRCPGHIPDPAKLHGPILAPG